MLLPMGGQWQMAVDKAPAAVENGKHKRQGYQRKGSAEAAFLDHWAYIQRLHLQPHATCPI